MRTDGRAAPPKPIAAVGYDSMAAPLPRTRKRELGDNALPGLTGE
jgi:hypothetical protein